MKLKPMGIPGQAPRHVKQWTKQEDALLISMYPKHSIREMTSRLNRSFHATGQRLITLRKRGLIGRKRQRLDEKAIAEIISNHHRKSKRDMAREMKCSKCTIQKILRDRGYSAMKCGGIHHAAKYDDHIVHLVTELRDGHGMPFREISRHIHKITGIQVAYSTVWWLYNRRTAADAVLYELLPN
ncbi:DNA-binding protein [Escherichia coli]|uniref:DNA-binding protein n=1 Tax=Escherichia coli TaxID=562 RepID=UPI0020C12959|nr:DNA-binding protein [Escherichia coli]